MILLVAEKPSVAVQHYSKMLERTEGERFQKHDGYLQGKRHTITWCVGHLVTLAGFEDYPGLDVNEWKIDNLPLIPEKFKLKAISKTKKQLGIVHTLMEKADVLVNGADAGREGNLIFDLTIDIKPELRKKTIKRLWVNSFVAKDLDKGWKNLEDNGKRKNLSAAARMRQRADWLVGLNGTRAYTILANAGLLSVGRVQTPTLNLIVQRDIEIENFTEAWFYGVIGEWNGLKAVWRPKEKDIWSKSDEIPKKIQALLDGKTASVVNFEANDRKVNPKKPFDLTELQKEGNRRFKFTAAKILTLTQSLYEAKVVSYPRTDSQYLTSGMKGESYALAKELASIKETDLMRPESDTFAFIDSSKVTDHYAIIPTGEPPTGLKADEKKIYDLIRDRFVMAWLKPGLWKEYIITLDCENEEFRIKATLNIDSGFKKLIESEETKVESDEISNKLHRPIEYRVGDSSVLKTDVSKKKKSKPAHYNESALLSAMKTAGKQIEDEDMAEAMKERGLGTPATQANIIETIKKRGYIKEEKNKLVSTSKGRALINLVDDQIKSPELTGEWEYKLNLMERGEYSALDFRNDLISYVKKLFEGLDANSAKDFKEQASQGLPQCPKCGESVRLVSWGYACTSECGFKLGFKISSKKLSSKNIEELFEKKKTSLIKGFKSREGKKFDAHLIIKSDFTLGFEFRDNSSKHICPECGSAMKDWEKSVSCPDKNCGFIIWKTVSGKKLTERNITDLIKEGQTTHIKGFKSKSGQPFDAYLKRNGNKIEFDFS